MARLLRHFRPGITAAMVAILGVGGLIIVYGVVLAHARHDYRALRARYCEHLVQGFYARHPTLKLAKLSDACVEWEALSGEVVR